MIREEMSEGVVLYCGDAAYVLPTLEPNSFDSLIVDPPFGISFKYANHNDSPVGYSKWLWSILEVAESKCKPASPIFVWQATKNIRHFPEWFPREWRVFVAAKNWVQMTKSVMQWAYDPVVVWWTPGDDVYAAGTSSRDWHLGNTTPSAHRGLNFVGTHPCPRPLNQVQHIVEQWVRPGGTILDCFMGSGTTLVAAVLTRRKAVGIEIDEGYFAEACRRVEHALKIVGKQVSTQYYAQPVQRGLSL